MIMLEQLFLPENPRSSDQTAFFHACKELCSLNSPQQDQASKNTRVDNITVKTITTQVTLMLLDRKKKQGNNVQVVNHEKML